MVLIDTSVWLHYLAGREPFLSRVKRLLARREIPGHELVYAELLMGDTGGRARLLDDYAELQQIPAVSNQDVIRFVRAHRLNGRGVGWIDVHLLAAAMAAKVPLWTADPRFEAVAREPGAAYSAT